MAFANRVRHWFEKNNESRASHDYAVDEFIATRQEQLRGVSSVEIETMTRAALSRADREETLRDAQTLRERWKSGQCAPRTKS